MAIQFIKSARPGKPITWYVYAFKNGPLVMKAIQPKKPFLTAEAHDKIAEAIQAANSPDPKTLLSLIHEWRAAPEWKGLAYSTRRVWGGHLDLIDARWGSKPLSVWDDHRMVGKVMNWRDERAATPRSADMGITVLRELLKFGRLRGRIRINVAEGVPLLYKGGDRAEIIWMPEDIEAFRVAAIEVKRPGLYDGLRLAALTGLRLSDLVSLTWDHLGDVAIVKTALKKSRGKRRKAVVPLTDALEKLLNELRTRKRKEGVNTVLVNERGASWTAAGFGGSGSFGMVRDKANIVHIGEGDDGQPVERKKHLHDVRGTFCTLLLTECELTDEDAARIMAWSPARVAKIRSTYVDSAAVVISLAERMRAKHGAKQSGG
ncbi:MAG: tyrosine-type recombinase/integrase [Sphingomonadaceae bacterium]